VGGWLPLWSCFVTQELCSALNAVVQISKHHCIRNDKRRDFPVVAKTLLLFSRRREWEIPPPHLATGLAENRLSLWASGSVGPVHPDGVDCRWRLVDVSGQVGCLILLTLLIPNLHKSMNFLNICTLYNHIPLCICTTHTYHVGESVILWGLWFVQTTAILWSLDVCHLSFRAFPIDIFTLYFCIIHRLLYRL